MKAVLIHPLHPESVHLGEVETPQAGPGQVRVQVLEVGVCGTDIEINQGKYGEAPRGHAELVDGHENLGVIESVGPDVRGFAPGDLVVATVRRPCPENCPNCRDGSVDMCSTGHYLERGIKGIHGFASTFYVEDPAYLVKLPWELRNVGVLLEPLSVVEKGIREAFEIQRRLRWEPRRVLVLGAGSIGLLAAMVLRLRGFETYVFNRGGPERPKARRAVELGAEYVSSDRENVRELARRIGSFDLVIEASGVSRLLYYSGCALAVNGVVLDLGIGIPDEEVTIPAGELDRAMVLGNQVLVGSVNAHRRDFEQGVRDMLAAQERFPGWLERVISRRVPLEQLQEAFRKHPEDVKVTLDLSPGRPSGPDSP